MAAPASIELVRSRANSYWHIDGIPWLVRGLQAMCWAVVLFFFLDRGPHSSLLGNLAFFFALCLDRGMILSLKSRITYPRTGYVSPPPPFQATHDELVLLRLNDDDLSSERSAPGPNISLVAIVALVLAAYAAFLMLESRIGVHWIAILIGSAGLLSSLLGTIKLLNYLRQNRRPAE